MSIEFAERRSATLGTRSLELRALAEGKGDIKGLQGPLEGCCRLRMGGIQIIYRKVSSKEIRLDFAQTRDAVYEIFERILQNRKEE